MAEGMAVVYILGPFMRLPKCHASPILSDQVCPITQQLLARVKDEVTRWASEAKCKVKEDEEDKVDKIDEVDEVTTRRAFL